MEQRTKDRYLGDIISDDGSNKYNTESRRNRGVGIINQIKLMLKEGCFGKYYFEAAMLMRESLLLSSLLTNSEAWFNISKDDIKQLEQVDEILLRSILEAPSNTGKAFLYLSLAAVPIRFLLIKKRMGFLHYILNEEKTSLIRQVFDAQIEDRHKNDFVSMVEEDLKILQIDMSFGEIGQLSKWKFKKNI